MADHWDEHNGLYFNRAGKPITLREFDRLFCDHKYRVVDRTEFPDGRLVSTVWLGLDHGWWREGPPIIFETMVFGPEQTGTQLQMSDGSVMQCYPDEHCERYATEAEALAGHERICNAIRQMRVSLDLAIADAAEQIEAPHEPDGKLGDEPREGD